MTSVPRPAASGKGQVYVWKNAPDYKNARLAEYQQMLKDRGITNTSDLKLLTANVIIENGALSESVIGDHGCSIGIPQRNVCQDGYSAKSFLRKYPAWNDYRVQLGWMADRTAYNYHKYNGNVFRTVVSHNSPAAAARNQDSCHPTFCYFQRVTEAARSLTSI